VTKTKNEKWDERNICVFGFISEEEEGEKGGDFNFSTSFVS